jgi:RNA polymerase sigma-70 factor (ECF subfamily)
VNKEDQELIADCLNGQTSAFGALVVRYQDRLYHTLVNVVGSTEDARDVAQDAFVQAFEKLKSFRGDSAFYSWLFRIALNAAVTRHRKQKRTAVSIEATHRQSGQEPTDPHPLADPGFHIEQSERQQAVWTALSELSEDFRTVLVLKEIEGMKYEEIADVLDCPVGTVRSRIHRGRIELRGKLQRLLKDEEL